MDQKDYHFYDIDEKQTEGRYLIDHDHNQSAPKSSNHFCAVLAGILAVLLLITSLGLGWFLFTRNTGSSINLSHAIMCTIAFLFAAFATFFAFSLWKGATNNAIVNPNIGFILYAGCVIFAVYFIVAALYLWVNQQFFSHYIQCSNTVASSWQNNFGGDYNDAQLKFWRIYLVLSIFAVLIAVCFAILANAAWSQLSNKVQSKKITLGISLIAVTVFGFLVLIWYLNNNATYNYIQSKLPGKFAYVPFIAFIFAIAALALAFLNAIFNFIKAKSVNFVFAALWTSFFLVFAIFVALLFRNAFTLSNQKAFNRQETAGFISQDVYEEYGAGKYLAAGQSCGSSFSTNAWDRSPVASAPLNPIHDCNSSDLMLWPWFLLAIFSAFLLGSAAIAAVSNFGLAGGEKDDDEYNAFHIFDVIVLVLILLLALGLGLWLIFRPAGINNAYQNSKSGLTTNLQGQFVPNSSYKATPSSISQNTPLPSQCYYLSKIVLPQFSNNNSTNAGYSVGVLVTNGKFNTNYVNSAAVASKNSRQFFFPNANNINDDFVNLSGKPVDVNNALRNLVVCQNSIVGSHGVYLNANAIDLTKLSNNGLTQGVAPVYVEPFTNGESANLNDFTNPVGSCAASCKYGLVVPTNGVINIRGTLLIKNADGSTTNYGVPEANIVLNLYQNNNGKQSFIAFGSYDASGNFLIQAPYVQNAAYKAVLHIDDKNNQYQSNLIDVLVNPPNTNSDLLVGNIYLTTLSGQGCKQTDIAATNTCFGAQAIKNAKVNLSIQDIVNPGQTLDYPLTLTIKKSFSELGEIVSTQSISSPNWSQSLPVGYYNAQISGSNYNNNVQAFTLDGDKTVNAYLEDKLNSGYRIYAAIDNTLDPNSDYDLNLSIRAQDGSQCVVSPVNKICPYATHVQSISQGQKGYEVIDVSNFTNSYYMVYITKNSAAPVNCQYTNTTKQRFLKEDKHENFSINPNEAVQIFTSFAGGNSGFSNAGSGILSSYVAKSNRDFNPIKYGGQSIIPNLFAAISTQGGNYNANSLFSQYVQNTNDATLFAQSMPILYQQNQINSQSNSILNSNSFSSVLVSSFRNNANAGTGNQENERNQVTKMVYNLIENQNANSNEIIRESNNLNPNYNFYDIQGQDQTLMFMRPYIYANTNLLTINSGVSSVVNPNNGIIAIGNNGTTTNSGNTTVVIVNPTPVIIPIAPKEPEDDNSTNIEIENPPISLSPLNAVTVIEAPAIADSVPSNYNQLIIPKTVTLYPGGTYPLNTEMIVSPSKIDNQAVSSNVIVVENQTVPIQNGNTVVQSSVITNQITSNEPDDNSEPILSSNDTISNSGNTKIISSVTNPQELNNSSISLNPLNAVTVIQAPAITDSVPSDYNQLIIPKTVTLYPGGTYPLNTEIISSSNKIDIQPVSSNVVVVENQSAPIQTVNTVSQSLNNVIDNSQNVPTNNIVTVVNTSEPVNNQVNVMSESQQVNNQVFVPENVQGNNTVTVLTLPEQVNNQNIIEEVVPTTNNVVLAPVTEQVSNQVVVSEPVLVNNQINNVNQPQQVANQVVVSEIVPENNKVIVVNSVEPINNQVNVVNEPQQVANQVIVSEPIQTNNQVIVSEPIQTNNQVIVSEPIQTNNQVIVSEPIQTNNQVIVSEPIQTNNQAYVITEPQENNNQVVISNPVLINNQANVVSEPQENNNQVIVSEQVPLNNQVIVSNPVESNNQVNVVTVPEISNDQVVLSNQVQSSNNIVNVLNEPEYSNNKVVLVPEKTSQNNPVSVINEALSTNNSPIVLNSAANQDLSAQNANAFVVSTAPENTNSAIVVNTSGENSADIIPDRRLNQGRLLQAVVPNYQTQFCFTGFGEISIKQINLSGQGIPSIQSCVDLYPDSDSFSLANLAKAKN